MKGLECYLGSFEENLNAVSLTTDSSQYRFSDKRMLKAIVNMIQGILKVGSLRLRTNLISEVFFVVIETYIFEIVDRNPNY